MGAIPGTFFDSIRDGVSRLTQPPLSVLPALPGSSGSYFDAPSYECTTPGLTRSVTWAIRSTEARSLYSFTTSPCRMPLAFASSGCMRTT